jgi:HPt (histidine-containing phosphotransfer) domain-containing protein
MTLLDRCLAANDSVAALRVAHTLKGAAATLGAKALAAAAGTLEAWLKAAAPVAPEPAEHTALATEIRNRFSMLADALSQSSLAR